MDNSVASLAHNICASNSLNHQEVKMPNPISIGLTAGIAATTFYLARKFKNETGDKWFNPWLWSTLSILLLSFLSIAIVLYHRYKIDKTEKTKKYKIWAIIAAIVWLCIYVPYLVLTGVLLYYFH